MARENEKEMGPGEERKWKTVDYYLPKTRNINLVPWPGTDKEVGILELNCDELQKARFAAIEHFAKNNIELNIFSTGILDSEEMVQQCYLFLIDPEARNYKYKVFRGADEARKKLTDDMRFYFCQQYNRLYSAK
jgi:hypothetical protein